jgi:hypothetical protein
VIIIIIISDNVYLEKMTDVRLTHISEKETFNMIGVGKHARKSAELVVIKDSAYAA